MNDLRNNIAAVIAETLGQEHQMDNHVADAIIAALPDMVAPLVWKKSKKNPLVSTAKMNLGPQYTMRISLSWGAIWSVDAVKGWHSASDEDAAKAAANAHHAAAVVAAITGEQP